MELCTWHIVIMVRATGILSFKAEDSFFSSSSNPTYFHVLSNLKKIIIFFFASKTDGSSTTRETHGAYDGDRKALQPKTSLIGSDSITLFFLR